MLLLPDGTVIASDPGSDIEISTRTWYKLTPDSHGSYVNGTWTRLAPMHDSRLYYTSAVLRSGKVLVAGGEYGSGGSTSEIYDPLADTWTQIPVPAGLITTGTASDGLNAGFRDSESITLPDGRILVAPVFPVNLNGTLVYDPVANSWSAGQPCLGSQNEASWVTLPDTSILTVNKPSTASERFIPSLNQWLSDKSLPVALYDACSEMGAGLLLPDGRAFYIGGTGHTALYTPSGNTSQGTWVPGPDVPNSLGASDAPAAVMVNGRVLCAVGPICFMDPGGGEHFPKPTSFFEFDPVANSFNPINGPTAPTDNVEPYKTTMLCLPDGSTLYAHHNNQLYVYRPDGGPQPAWKPAIQRIDLNNDGSFHLTGTQLNGLSQGAAYGDDAQMNSNYPLVRLSDGSGNVYYAQTYNWSSTGVMTGNTPVTTEFSLNPFVSPGSFSLVTVANGISSDPVSFYSPVWVDFNYIGILQFGTYVFPYKTTAQGISAVDPGGTVAFKGPASSPETMTIAKAMTLRAVGGAVTIGR